MSNTSEKYAIFTVIYRGQEYKSDLLDLYDDAENTRICKILAESGTSGLTMLKLPLSQTSYIIFSREQLDECLIRFDYYLAKPKQKIAKSKTKTISE